MTNDPKPWEVWWAKVRYEDSEEVKTRPILINGKNCGMIIAFKITTHEPRNEWGEYPLAKWRECGLKKESTVRLRHVINIDLSKCISKIGVLHHTDIIYIRNILSSSKLSLG